MRIVAGQVVVRSDLDSLTDQRSARCAQFHGSSAAMIAGSLS